MSYWDSSALVKLYLKEADSSVFEQLAANAPTNPTTTRLALYEIQTTLRRKEAEGTLAAGSAETNYLRLIQDATNVDLLLSTSSACSYSDAGCIIAYSTFSYASASLLRL